MASAQAPRLARHMRLIVARCEVLYSGRLHAVLPEALRLLMIKSDGSVMVHADTGATSRRTDGNNRLSGGLTGGRSRA